jgi:hypothetical protein
MCSFHAQRYVIDSVNFVLIFKIKCCCCCAADLELLPPDMTSERLVFYQSGTGKARVPQFVLRNPQGEISILATMIEYRHR